MRQQAENFVAHHLAYTFLSRVFYESPTLDFLQAIMTTQDDLFGDWPLASKHPQVRVGLTRLQACATEQAVNLKELKQDYTRLFVGPGELLAHPWESVYRNPERLIFDKHTHQVRTMYHRFGMTTPKPGREPEDHIGLEFAFVAHLCQQALVAIQWNQQQQLTELRHGLRSLFAEHLSQWAHEFLSRVIQYSDTAYYRGVAELATGCISHSTNVFVRDKEDATEWT